MVKLRQLESTRQRQERGRIFTDTATEDLHQTAVEIAGGREGARRSHGVYIDKCLWRSDQARLELQRLDVGGAAGCPQRGMAANGPAGCGPMAMAGCLKTCSWQGSVGTHGRHVGGSMPRGDGCHNPRALAYDPDWPCVADEVKEDPDADRIFYLTTAAISRLLPRRPSVTSVLSKE